VRVGFVLLASSTAFDVFAYVRSKARPPKVGGDELAGFKVSGVSCGFVVVTTCENGVPDRVVIRDVDTAFVGEDSSLVLPIGEAGAEGEGNGTVHRLEGLEYEGVVGGGGLDAVGEGGVDDSDKE